MFCFDFALNVSGRDEIYLINYVFHDLLLFLYKSDRLKMGNFNGQNVTLLTVTLLTGLSLTYCQNEQPECDKSYAKIFYH